MRMQEAAAKATRPVLSVDGVHRWQATTRTITKEQAKECERRIKNYRQLQAQMERLVTAALKSAPWIE